MQCSSLLSGRSAPTSCGWAPAAPRATRTSRRIHRSEWASHRCIAARTTSDEAYSPFANWGEPQVASSGSNGWHQEEEEQHQQHDGNGASSSEQRDFSWEDRLALQEREAREQRAAKERELELQRLERFQRTQRALSQAGKGGARVGDNWRQVEKGGGKGGGADLLYELGASSYQNTRVDAGQNYSLIDGHIAGNFLGTKADIADGSLRRYEFRSFNNIVGDYYVAPQFMEAVTMHVVKNYLVEMGAFDSKVKVPLILGIWGERGMGKTFQTELALKKLGAEAVVMSAGELEHEWAGTPGRLIRERYKKAGEMSKVRGKFCCLIINDIDAGLGHFENTQVTVNNQIVIGTLMNIADNPNKVSVGEDWQENDQVRRSPIIVTGNDFSHMFAPLIRDGRMNKFYYKPSVDDIVNILYTIYVDDGLSIDDMVALVKRFPKQPLDFFGALRAATYDSQIREWIEGDVLGGRITAEDANMAALSERLARKSRLPKFQAVQLTLHDLIREGERLEREQELVLRHNLAHEYLKPMKKMRGGGIGFKG